MTETTIDEEIEADTRNDRNHGRAPQFDDAWEQKWRSIIDLYNSEERHNEIYKVKDEEEIEEISYLMTYEEWWDYTRWSAKQGKGVETPFQFARIFGLIPLPYFMIVIIVGLILGLYLGMPIQLFALLFFFIFASLIVLGFMLGKELNHEEGKCVHCKANIATEKSILLRKWFWGKGDKKHSNAGYCNRCHVVYDHYDVNLDILHNRIDTIFSKENKAGWGRWKDPATGFTYRYRDKFIPKNRTISYWIKKQKANQREGRDITKQLEKAQKRARLT